jgi:TonB family protein
MSTADEYFKKSEPHIGLKLSAFLHFAFILFILIQGVFFPDQTIPYIPTLKVDLVGLPDVLKKDLALPNQTPTKEIIAKTVKKIEQQAKEAAKHPPKEVAKKDEMVMKSKPQALKKQESVTDTRLEKKNQRALDRLKSLAKIQEGPDVPQKLIKGNKISPGSSLSGEAKEALTANYYDLLRDRLKENWSLPIWLSRQNYRANVMVSIDPQGRLIELKFTKSSGNSQFDDAVKRAFQNSVPLPIPPQELKQTLLSHGILVGFPL